MQNGDANLAVPETLFLFNPPADYQPLIVRLNWLNIVSYVGTRYQLPNYYSNTRLEVSFKSWKLLAAGHDFTQPTDLEQGDQQSGSLALYGGDF